MIPPAILPLRPNGPALDSRPDGAIPSQDAIPDFSSLLLASLVQPEAEQTIESCGDVAAPADTEVVSSSNDPPEVGSSFQLVLPPIILLNLQPFQLVTNEPAGELSPAPNILPAAALTQAAAQAPGLDLSSVEAVENATPDTDTDGATASAPSTSEANNAAPQAAAATQPVGETNANVSSNAFQSIDLPAGLAVTPRSDYAQAGNAGAEKLAGEAAQGQQISSELNTLTLPEPTAARGSEKDSGERKNNGADKQDRQAFAASSHARIELPRDPETFVPPGFMVADAQVAAHVEGAVLLPSEHSGFPEPNHDGKGFSKMGGGIEPQAQAAGLLHETFFHPIERERTPDIQPSNAWSATIERLAADISTHVRQGQHEVTMRLEPPELGNLQIELSLEGDRLQARVTADMAEAGTLIQTHLPELRQALQAHNLNLVNVQVDLGGSGGLAGNLAQGSHRQADEPKHSPGLGTLTQGLEAEPNELGGNPSLARGAVSVWA
jgi:flagellar hook-length control protein FliK